MGMLTNSKDPDEMLHNAEFHQGLHCLLKKTRSLDKIITCNLTDMYKGLSQVYHIKPEGRIN